MRTQPEAGPAISSSFTDLMTSLAVIFILLLCATLNNARQEGENTRDTILAELRKALQGFAAAQVEVKSDPRDPLGLLILVPVDLLAFQLDRAEIPQRGEAFLRAFIPRLSSIICSEQFSREINSIVVEGHADSSGKAPHNWDLSQRRSMSVVRTSLGVLADGAAMKERSAFLSLLSASGRGSAELVTGPTGEENPAMSRRVIFKIRVRSFEQKPLLETLEPRGA